MPAIDSMFARTRATPKPKPKRRKMLSFKLDEISLVDKPAQEGAKVAIMKRRTTPPLHAMPVNYDHALADVARYRKCGQHQRANELESALALHANVIFLKSAAGESVMTLFDKARKASASAPASASAGSFAYEDEMNKDDDIEAALAALQAEGDEEYLEPLDDEEADKAEDDIDPDELEEMEAAELEEEILETKAGQDMNDRTQPFEEDTEIGIEANRQMRDKRTSKRTAFSKAVARAIAKRGGYGEVFLAKAEARSTTDSAEPFHQQRAPQRRAEMDRRTVATRNAANAELAAMREGASMGREMEEKRRMIDGMVMKLRTVDPRMRHQDALRKVRSAYPALFG